MPTKGKNPEVLHFNNITKLFGDVVANDKISFSIKAGEIHALLGENGAGKSTLMNILNGIYQLDSGELLLADKTINVKSPKAAIDLGIGMIHQHFKLLENAKGLDNLLLGQVPGFWLNKKKALQKYQDLIKEFNLNIDLHKYVNEMSMGEKQILEILKVLAREPRILVFDEPTTVLTPQEIDNLFNIMIHLKNHGYSLIFITHKMSEVMKISDRVTVLRKGQYIKTLITTETNPRELTDLMVGHHTELKIKRLPVLYNESLLVLENVSVADQDNVEQLKGISFKVGKGEIVGIAGISGHGQKELCEAIVGMQKLKSGSIYFQGEDLSKYSVKEIIRKGIGMSFVPEDRLGMGLVAGMDIVDNIFLKDYQKLGFWLDKKNSEVKSEDLIKRLNINTTGKKEKISLMSGGNIQKVLVGRELATEPQLLITAYPVRGLDIATSYIIYDLINEQKTKGAGIIFISEDLEALIELSDRIVVLNHGAVSKIVKADETSKEELGYYMMSNAGEHDEIG